MIRVINSGYAGRVEAALREQWKTLAGDALRRAGHRSGGAREAVVEQLARESCCVTAQQLVARIGGRQAGAGVGIASVYRALDLLAGIGLVQRVELGEGAARFEAVMPGGEHHHHVVCERCGRLTAFEDEGLERAIARLAARLGHVVSSHDVLLHGTCERCGWRGG